MSEEQDLLRAAYAALSRRDVDRWLVAVLPDAVMHDFPPTGSIYRGQEELRKWAESALEIVASWQLTPEEFSEGDGGLLVRLHVTGVSVGAEIPVDQVIYNVLEFKGPKVATIRSFFDRTEALEAAGLSE